MWHAIAYVLTFPEGLIWPSLTRSWYPVVCAAWLPIGGVLFVRAWREASWNW